MKRNKLISFLFVIGIFCFSVNAQVSDEDLSGSADDDFFDDDGIVELEVNENESVANADLKKGILFQDGSVKTGGSFTTSVTTNTLLYSEDEKSFGDYLSETVLTPEVSAYLTIDARPNQNLRMYSKFGLAYPFQSTAASSSECLSMKVGEIFPESDDPMMNGILSVLTEIPVTVGVKTTTSVTDFLKVKELFTDFNIGETAFFRFGLHTVTWGTGYFFSPVSDMINTTSIDPEDVDAQVDGALNLRTQIVFPNTQNCLWLYVIPDTDFITTGTVSSFAKYTALAGKYDFVIGGWELGAGAFWKYEHAPKAMLTASGSIGNLGLFGEGVYQYGGAFEWENSTKWYEDKTNIFQATIGGLYNWKTPLITLAAQYYYDGNSMDRLVDIDKTVSYLGQTSRIKIDVPGFTQGHNIALAANFGRVFGTRDVTAAIFGMMNFGRDSIVYEVPAEFDESIEQVKAQVISLFNTATFSALLYYTPISTLKMGIGPYVTVKDFETAPDVAVRLSFSLGGGKF